MRYDFILGIMFATVLGLILDPKLWQVFTIFHVGVLGGFFLGVKSYPWVD